MKTFIVAIKGNDTFYEEWPVQAEFFIGALNYATTDVLPACEKRTIEQIRIRGVWEVIE